MPELGLSEVVRALRAELDAAMTAGEGERVQFKTDAVELEFQVGVTKTAEARGGIRFWVLELGGGLDLGEEALVSQSGSQLGTEHLHSNPAAMPQVPREIDGGHAALPELPLDGVAAG